MTTPEQATPQIDLNEMMRILGRIEEGMRQMGHRLDRIEEDQREGNRRTDDTNHRIDETNRRIDENQRETSQRIDRLIFTTVAMGVAMTAALLGGLLTVAFVG